MSENITYRSNKYPSGAMNVEILIGGSLIGTAIVCDGGYRPSFNHKPRPTIEECAKVMIRSKINAAKKSLQEAKELADTFKRHKKDEAVAAQVESLRVLFESKGGGLRNESMFVDMTNPLVSI